MADMSQGSWIGLIILAIIAGLALLWLYAANRKTRIEAEDRDDAAPARRNQALIDSAPAAPPPAPPAPPPEPETAEPVAPAAPSAPADDLSRIKGLGPRLKSQLAELGITSFAQIAGWSEADIDRIDAQLGRFQGRIRRDDWVSQARLLAAGDIAAYEAQFGKT